MKLFELTQTMPHHRLLTTGMFHRFLVSLAWWSRKCRLLYVILQTNSVIQTWLVKVWCAGTSHHSHGQCITQGRFPHTQTHDRPSSTQEAFLRLDWHNILLTNFQPQLCIENRWAAGSKPSGCSRQSTQSSFSAPISLPTAPLDRDHHHQHPQRYHVSDGRRSHVSSCVVWP